METVISALLVISSTLVAIPVAVILLEVVASYILSQPGPALPVGQQSRPRVAVLVPAHNEGPHLLPTMEDIKAQLRPGDRLLVVADNCTDDTAAIAAKAGAEVIRRDEPTKIGKGYALDYGIRHLSADPPDVVVMIDADCRIAAAFIEGLSRASSIAHRPVQALYLMAAPGESAPAYRVAEFAWRVKNWVRPLGLRALNLPCHLVGSGMAFPWDIIRSVDLANGWIVEDLKLGVDLAIAGHSPEFCPSARVNGTFAPSAKGAETQRKRWEQGHISMILTAAPRLMWMGISRRNVGLMFLGLDLAVPPLSLLAALVVGMFVISTLVAFFGASSGAVVISTASLIGFILPVLASWAKYGRDILNLRTILAIPGYVVSKFPIYRNMLFGNVVGKWTRTDRRQR